MAKSLIGIVFVAALALASGFLGASVQPDGQTIAGAVDQTIVAQAASMPELSTFVTALKAAGLVDALSAQGPFTVFAPSNDAFAALPAGKLALLLKPENKALLVDVLKYHVVAGKTFILPADITDAGFIKTLEGRNVETANIRGKIFINTAKIIQSNLIASNGIFHVIDAVLDPGVAPGQLESIVKRASANPELSTFVTALNAAGLVKTLSTKGPFTVFAPSNKAFAALPQSVLANLLKPESIAQLVDLLTYHVVAGEYGAGPFYTKDMNFHNDPNIKSLEGASISTGFIDGKLYIDTAEVTAADISASNGVIHIIDQVLNPAAFAPRTVVGFAVATPELSTLVTALEAAGLVDTLSGKGAFTVFAPSNEAFAKLPKGVLANLLKPENKAQLVDLLTYHVAQGPRDFQAAFLQDGQMIKTVEGKSVTVRTVASDSAPSYLGKAIFIDSAKVMFADNGAENGVVHIIDAVLMPGAAPPAPTPAPAAKTIVDRAIATPELSTLVTALKAAGLVDTLSGKGPFTVFAPTNEAFAALPEGVLANLLKPENKAQLVALLTYHVLSGDLAKAYNSDHFECSFYECPVKTLEGEELMIRRVGDQVLINSAKVVVPDVLASNGGVQVIDAVLMLPTPQKMMV